MTVLCFMYHQTPRGSAQSRWDVPLDRFKDQIERLIDAGATFVPFSETPKAAETDGLNVCVTFDDGHASNAPAFEFLATRSIRPAAFIVSEWSRRDPEFLDATAIRGLVDICDFGAHGATHTGMSGLAPQALDDELLAVSAYLADATGEPTITLALPGGDGGARELRAARRAGYQIVGNSVADINRRSGFTVNRICVMADMPDDAPAAWALGGEGYWLKKRAFRALSRGSAAILGDSRHVAMTGGLKRLLRWRAA